MIEKKKEKAIAKVLFFEFKSPKQILEQLDIAPNTLSGWSKEWKSERQEQTQAIVRMVREKNAQDISELFNVGIPLIKRALESRATEGQTPLTIPEAKMVTDIMCSFDKIQRLEVGSPTDIKETKEIHHVTIEDLRQAVLKDEFIEIKGKVK